MNHFKISVLLSALIAVSCHEDRTAKSADEYDDRLTPAAGEGGPRPVQGFTDATVTGIEDIPNDPLTTTSQAQPGRSASARFLSAKTHQVKGTATLTETAQGVRIVVEIAGAPPGEKGLHVHQTNDCSDIPNKSMGAHFEGETPTHGLPNVPHHHLGDLGNIRVAGDGIASLEISVKNANLKPGDRLSFLNRSIVLHEGRDDGGGDSGNSGKPIACAPIQAAVAETR